jgi:hypothetical protein
VQSGLTSYGFEFGPLSSYEHCIHDLHNRVRAACPVTQLAVAPTSGTLRQRNEEMRAAQA